MLELLRRQVGPDVPSGAAYSFRKPGQWPAHVWQIDGEEELYYGIVSYPTACDAPGWLSAGEVSDASRALRVLEAACDCVEPWGPGLEALQCWFWTPYSLCAEKWTLDRPAAALAGDAAHLLSPLGGFGMNLGVGDAASLGWRLAAVLNGWLEPGAALSGYEAERREAWARCDAYVVAERARLMGGKAYVPPLGRGGAYETALLGPCVNGQAVVGHRLPHFPGVRLETRGVTLLLVNGGEDLVAAIAPAFVAACGRIGIPCRTCIVDGAQPAVAVAFGGNRLAICRPDAVVTFLGAAACLPEAVVEEAGLAAEALLLGEKVAP
mmetsp:Transcript_7727/g.22645  ORF Transcript_7727/g.22645 Transcript_7727/m.22645 type:complete len:323 (+) Transcript_7727:851-1819(+)